MFQPCINSEPEMGESPHASADEEDDIEFWSQWWDDQHRFEEENRRDYE